MRGLRFGDVAEPLAYLLQRRDVFAVIVERWRSERRFDFSARRQEPELVGGDGRLDRRFLAPVRQQLVERARIHHRAGQPVMSDLSAFLDDEDFERASGRLRELTESNSAGKARRARSYEENVDFQLIALRHRGLVTRQRSGLLKYRGPR